ncbi:hypothetical protein Hanom_Chr06g00553051 [Helianthus anomalus]
MSLMATFELTADMVIIILLQTVRLSVREGCINLSFAFSIISLIFNESSNLQRFYSRSSSVFLNIRVSQKVVRHSHLSTFIDEEEVYVKEGPVPVHKWDQGLFEQLVRGFQFPAEWDARYPQQGQTTANAPPGYITLFADFFLEGNFRFSATHLGFANFSFFVDLMGSILTLLSLGRCIN